MTRNSVLERLLAERRNDPQAPRLHSGIEDAEGQLLCRLIEDHDVDTILEIGLANGYSTLFMLDALDRCGRGVVVSLDPFQTSDWKDSGLIHIAEAGLTHRHRHLALRSWEAVEALRRFDRPFDMGFVDGSHDFDNFFVDMYIVDKFVKPGGIIVVDDLGWGSVRRAFLYYMMNRSYEVVELVPKEGRSTWTASFKRAIKRMARRFGRSDIHPGAEVQRFERCFEQATMVAVRKLDERTAEDSFVPF